MKLIFLDIDGVLTTPGNNWHFNKECVDNLIELIRSCDAKIVVCSSWRESTLEQTLRYLPAKLREHIIAQTPDIPNEDKGKEVQSYIHQHPSQLAMLEDEYIIIDDDPASYMPFQRSMHLVTTDMAQGFTREDMQKAERILKHINTISYEKT